MLNPTLFVDKLVMHEGNGRVFPASFLGLVGSCLQGWGPTLSSKSFSGDTDCLSHIQPHFLHAVALPWFHPFWQKRLGKRFSSEPGLVRFRPGCLCPKMPHAGDGPVPSAVRSVNQTEAGGTLVTAHPFRRVSCPDAVGKGSVVGKGSIGDLQCLL